ncbi:MAG: DUF2244 domain-containing protein [Alphaproteobacteria bacterium]|nr:DUF2244 domain-containing protein [Alphaproteobacteria bacterium]
MATGPDRAVAPVAGAEVAGAEVLFEAELRPYRSLAPNAFMWLMVALTVPISGLGIAFYLMGAWPVFGFLGLDVVLIYLAFRASYRSGRLREKLRLSARDLVVRRISPSGEVRSLTFAPPQWLRVTLAEPVESDTPLELASHGRYLRIGAFLPPGERQAVAVALQGALRRLRTAPHQA